MAHCPNCWSGVDSLEGVCPQCGLPLRQRNVRRTGQGRVYALAGLVAAAAVTAAILSFHSSGGADSGETGTAPRAADPDPPAVADEAREAPADAGRSDRVAPRSHLLVESDGETFAALALVGAAGPRLLLPVDVLRRAAGLTRNGDPFDPLVVHVDRIGGFVLLAPRGDLPDQVRPLAAAAWSAAAQRATTLAPDGRTAPAGALAPGPDGRLRLAGDVTVGTAVLDANGAALGYVDAVDSAIALGPVVPWLANPGRQSLTDARLELRATDPVSLVEDAATWLAAENLDLAGARSALDALLTAETLARDRELFGRILGLLPVAFARVIVRELPTEPTIALERGRAALARFGDDPGLLAVTAQAAAAAGEPAVAADLTTRLRAVDPSTAETVLRSITEACLAAVERLSEAGRHDEATAASARLADLAPMRGDLAAEHARTLERAGRMAEALSFAQRAAALDETHAGLAERLATALGQAADPGVVRIPYDPRSGSIRAEVRIGSHVLPMVVDTGATLTTIPTAVARELGLLRPDARRVEVETANGRVEGTAVRLPTLQIGTLELRNVSAVALDLPGTLVNQGLLGLSALRRVDVQLDAAAGEIVFRQRRRR